MSDRDTQTSEDDLLQIGDVARLCGVTVATVRNWERRGAITATRTPGNQRRFKRADVDTLLRPTDA